MDASSVAEEEVQLRKAWYAHQENGGGYAEDEYTLSIYPWLSWDCWRGWSKLTVNNMVKALKFLDRTNNTVADLGAGIGLTTAQLAQMLPGTPIAYTNVPGPQTEVAKQIFAAAGVDQQIQIILDRAPRAETVLASELLEHISAPIDYLAPHLVNCTTYVDASSFTLESHGHMLKYEVDGEVVPREQMRRKLNKYLRAEGFTEMRKVGGAPKFWNNRPAVWMR